MLFSPANQAATPPSLGIAADISAIVLAAFAATVTSSGLMPLTSVAKSLRPVPKAFNWPPNAEMLFSPANHAATPPSLGMIAAISAMALAAFADASTTAGSTFLIASAYVAKSDPNVASSPPNLVSEDSPVNQEAMPSRILAPVRVRMISAMALTPSIVDASIDLAPSMNG